MRWRFWRKPKWKPCVPITCPPAEKISVTWTPIRCPDCGVVPYSCHSIFDEQDHRIVWTCPTHGVLDFGRPA